MNGLQILKKKTNGIARTVPFGYKQSEEDPDILDPIPVELDLLEKARKYVKSVFVSPSSQLADTNSGRYISHVGLRKRLANERQRKNTAKSLRKWAEYAETAIAKAKEIEEARTGARSSSRKFNRLNMKPSKRRNTPMYCSSLIRGRRQSS